MKTTLKMLAVLVVLATTSNAFAANRYSRDYGQIQQYESYDASAMSPTDRSFMVEETGN